MNSENDTTRRQNGISGESALAIISVALAAFWIAFAFYKGGSPDENGNRIMLLHPLIPAALIGLLIRIYRWVGIKFVVQLEIILISIWLVIRMLGVLMPFILGFGFAYLFRFLWKALPFKRIYQRVIATVLIILICSGVLIFTVFRVGQQVGQMAQGLQKFYHEALLPLVVGEKFTALTSYVEGETETLFLSTNHGIYLLEEKEVEDTNKENSNLKRIGITNGELVGKSIQCIAVSDKFIYAGTQGGMYRCGRKIVEVARGETEYSLFNLPEELIWKKINATRFNDRSIEAINIPSWDPSLVYVGTETGLYMGTYSDDDIVEQWKNVKDIPDSFIVSMSSIERFSDTRKTRTIYLAGKRIETETPLEQEGVNDNSVSLIADMFKQLSQESPAVEKPTDTNEQNGDIITKVYRLGSQTEPWERLPHDEEKSNPVPEVKVLAVTDKSEVNLYAGTVNGLYKWHRDSTKDDIWTRMDDSDRLPKSISLIVASPSGLYVGNSGVIHHSIEGKSNWKKYMSSKIGILMYRDDPYVTQFQEYLTKKIPGWTASGGAFIRWLSGLAGSIAFQFGGFIATVFLAFIVFVYASQGFEKYFKGFISLVPERHQETAKAYFREIDNNMNQFLKGQFTVIVIITIISCIVYRLINVPFALLVGILAGFCNAIPTFGPFIGGGFAYIAMLMGLVSGVFSSPLDFAIRCLFVLGAILGIQALDNSLISPKVMSHAVDVDPLLIMFAVIVGASILGIWGVLLAIPIIVVIKSIIVVTKANANGAETPELQEQS